MPRSFAFSYNYNALGGAPGLTLIPLALKLATAAVLALALLSALFVVWQTSQLSWQVGALKDQEAILAELRRENRTLEFEAVLSGRTLPKEAELLASGFEKTSQLHFLDLAAGQVARQESVLQP